MASVSSLSAGTLNGSLKLSQSDSANIARSFGGNRSASAAIWSILMLWNIGRLPAQPEAQDPGPTNPKLKLLDQVQRVWPLSVSFILAFLASLRAPASSFE